jgi:hypothetical protein
MYSNSPRPVFLYLAAFCSTRNGISSCFSSAEWFGTEFREVSVPRNSRNSEILLLFLFHGTEFPVVFSSAEGFGTEFRQFVSIFVPRNGIPSCFLSRGRVRNRIPRVCFILFLLHGTEFRVFFSSAEGFGT